METLVVFRHGKSELNLRSELTGEEAERCLEMPLPPDADLTAGLIEEGREDARLLQQQTLASIAIDICFSSPALRAFQTGAIGLEGRIDPDQFIVRAGLTERYRGLFHFLPDVVIARLKREHPEYWQEPLSTLRRRPKDGETLLEVIDRLIPVVEEAETSTHGTVAFSTHAEATIALRALVGRLGDDQLAAPLVPYQTDILPLQRANWIGHCQTDIYTKRNPYDNSLAPYMTHFQSIGVKPRPFTTGWLELPPL